MTAQIERPVAVRHSARRNRAESVPALDDGERTLHIQAALEDRLTELRMEYAEVVGEFTGPESSALAPDTGDDIADIGTKTFAREQEMALAHTIRLSMHQVERALEALSDGSYGWCETCGESIPPARLAAFPSATLCVRCKRRQERH